METHLTKDGQVPIPGYKIFRNDTDILIAINWKLNREDTIGQTLWILIGNEKTQVRMGVIYESQENVTPNSKLKKLNGSISHQVNIGKKEQPADNYT